MFSASNAAKAIGVVVFLGASLADATECGENWFSDNVTIVKNACADPVCMTAKQESYNEAPHCGGVEGCGNKTAACVCKATSLVQSLANSNGGQAPPVPDPEAENFEDWEAYCGIQECYDWMVIAYQAEAFVNYCGPFPDPSTVEKVPAVQTIGMTITSTAEAFDNTAQENYCNSLKTLTLAEGCAVTNVQSGSLVVTSELTYESTAEAKMASNDFEALTPADLSSELGITVSSVDPPTVATGAGSSSSSSSSDDDLSTGALIGIIIGSVVGVILLGGVAFLAFRGPSGGNKGEAASTTPKSTTSV